MRIRIPTSLLRYTLILLVVLLFGILLWWYFFLGAKQDSLEATDDGRGAGVEAPSFGNAIGSTYGNIVSSIGAAISNTSEEEPAAPQTTPPLWHAAKSPVAGASFILNGTTTAIRFVERGTGYVLEANPETGELTRITNTLIPRVYEAYVGANGSLILRSLDEADNIVTSAGQIVATTSEDVAPKPLALRQLPLNIRTIALHPEGEEVFYIEPGYSVEDEYSIVRAAWNGTAVKRIGTVGISGWQAKWLSDDRIILTQNAGGTSNYAYELAANGSLVRLANPAGGLVVLPRPNSKALLYGSASNGFLLSVLTDANADPKTLSIRTTADKCVWSPSAVLIVYCAVPQTLPGADFLTARAQGTEHTADTWWKIDIRTGRAEILPVETMPQVDVENPIMDPSGKYLLFTNSRDKSLWLVRI